MQLLDYKRGCKEEKEAEGETRLCFILFIHELVRFMLFFLLLLFNFPLF